MATYEILSTDYPKHKVDGDYIYTQDKRHVKTFMKVKFIRDDKIESDEQYYEVDSDDEEMIKTQLQASADEYNTRIL